MAQTSRYITVGKSPDFVMTRGEIAINHRALFKVYCIESGAPMLTESDSPFDRSLAVVVENLKQKLVAYGWDERSYVNSILSAPAVIIIVTGSYMMSLTYKLEPKLTQKQREQISNEFRSYFERKLDNNIAQNDERI